MKAGISALLVAAFVIPSHAHAASAYAQREVVADLIPGCRFRAAVPVNASVTTGPVRRDSGGISVDNALGLKTTRYIEPFYLGFACRDAGASLAEGMAVRFDKTSGTWLRSIENRYGPPDSERERRQLEGAIRLHPLSSVNASGFAYTEDDLIGEESGRRRVLHYCLIHPPKALCGSGEMGYLQDIRRHPQNDLTP
jgi:hypothetical protein